MLMPVRCFSCGKPLTKGVIRQPENLRYCCKRMITCAADPHELFTMYRDKEAITPQPPKTNSGTTDIDPPLLLADEEQVLPDADADVLVEEEDEEEDAVSVASVEEEDESEGAISLSEDSDISFEEEEDTDDVDWMLV